MAQTTATDNQNSKISDYQKIANRKIDLATAGLQPFIFKGITQNVSPENALIITEYILAMKTETNISDDYRSLLIKKLSLLRFSKNKSFIHMGREDVLRYLDSCRKPDASNPLHKWIGTYNSGRTIPIKFFLSSLKTAVIELFRKWPQTYYTDNFSAKSMVTHTTAVSKEQLSRIDMDRIHQNLLLLKIPAVVIGLFVVVGPSPQLLRT